MLDIESLDALIEYLRASGRIKPTEQPRASIMQGGVSNRTVLLERESGEAWVIKQALEKLRVKADWFADVKRIEREATALKTLGRMLPGGSTPVFVFEDRDIHLLAMTAIPQPHENWKTMLLSGNVQLTHAGQFATLLAQLHRASWMKLDELNDLEDRSFFESLRIEPYYLYSAQHQPDAVTFINFLIAATRTRRFSLVHGDYSPKNVLVHLDKLVLLDFEVMHFGDPAFDLGFSLAHFLSKAHHLPAHRHAFADAAMHFAKTYLRSLGMQSDAAEIDRFGAQHALACLLARVAGRSPLEYLTADEQRRQCHVVLDLMKATPASMIELIDQFLDRVTRCP